MRLLDPFSYSLPAAPAARSHYHVDDVILLEPNLDVPGKKPVGPVKIDWSHPLAKGLSCFLIQNSAAFIDVVNDDLNREVTKIVRYDETGTSAEFSGSSSTFATFGGKNITGPHTIAAIVDVDTLTNYTAIVACQDSTTTNGWEFRIGEGSTDSPILLHRANSNYRQYKASGSDLISAGSKRNFVAVTAVNSNINATPTFYVDGTKYTGIYATGTGAGNIVASTHDLYVGKRETNTTYLDGSVHMFALWPNRQLSDGEIESLRLDPYQFLIPA